MEKEISDAALRIKKDKALGPDKIPNRVIQILAGHRPDLI